MTLVEYLRSGGRGAKARLAESTGLAYSTIHWIETGRTRPKVATAQRIEQATGGAVTAAELLGLVDHHADAAE